MNKNIILKTNEKRIIPFLWMGKEDKVSYQIRLSGQGADLTFLMLILAKDSNNLNINIDVIHEKPETKSRVIIKGALDNNAHVDFEGLVKINPGAKHSNAWLAAHLLLLSPNAGGSAIPKLEISEKDVRAGHASTIGKVDELQLFYLRSRGITKETSTNLIVQGFLENLLSEFPIKDAQKTRKELKWI